MNKEERKTLCKDEFNNCEIVIENKQLKELIYEYEKEHSTIFREWLNVISEHRNYKNAWEELKEYITKENITIQGVEVLEQEDLIDKMQELEQKHGIEVE